MFRSILAFGFATFAVAGPINAHGFSTENLVIGHPMAFETPGSAMAAAGYMTIQNNGDVDDRLLQVEADFPRVMLHATRIEDDVARMIHLEHLEIPAGETVELVPGGLHVMFMGLNGDPFEKGEIFPATLVFEKAGRVDVVFYVEARPEGELTVDHSHH